jgi:hypothetical protein
MEHRVLNGSIAKYHVLSGVGIGDWRKPFKSPFEKGGFRGISNVLSFIKSPLPPFAKGGNWIFHSYAGERYLFSDQTI